LEHLPHAGVARLRQALGAQQVHRAADLGGLDRQPHIAVLARRLLGLHAGVLQRGHHLVGLGLGHGGHELHLPGAGAQQGQRQRGGECQPHWTFTSCSTIWGTLLTTLPRYSCFTDTCSSSLWILSASRTPRGLLPLNASLTAVHDCCKSAASCFSLSRMRSPS